MPDKLIEIHRKSNFIQDSNNDPEVKDYFDMAFKAIGSYFREFGKIYESGLTRKEEEILLPDVLGGAFPGPGQEGYEFRKKVQEYYRDINTKIPPEGLKLNIGLEQEGELAHDNPPIKIIDYLRWKHALKHLQVAGTKDEADMYQHKMFYIVDKQAQSAEKTKLRDLEDKAQTEYLQINRDASKVEMVLTLLGVSTRNMTIQDMILTLKEQATLLPDASEVVNSERLTRFIAIVNDRELATKYDIMEMVRVEILERIKSKVLIKESGETIGDNLREAVVWMLDKANSKPVNLMYARLDELGKGKRIKHNSPHLSDKLDTKQPVTASTADND